MQIYWHRKWAETKPTNITTLRAPVVVAQVALAVFRVNGHGRSAPGGDARFFLDPFTAIFHGEHLWKYLKIREDDDLKTKLLGAYFYQRGSHAFQVPQPPLSPHLHQRLWCGSACMNENHAVAFQVPEIQSAAGKKNETHLEKKEHDQEGLMFQDALSFGSII